MFFPGLKWPNRKLSASLAVLLGLALLVGCKTENKQKWLTFFFDGVPNPNATNASVVIYDENGQPLDRAPAIIPTNAAPVVKIQFHPHPPYENKECDKCHESRFSVKMRGPLLKVCADCHQRNAAKG